MKRIFLYIFLFFSQVANAQLSEDSLKNICKDLSEKQLNGCDTTNGWVCKIQSVDELFKGYFKNIKIFMAFINYYRLDKGRLWISDHSPMVFHWYILNPATGKKVDWNEISEFNKLFEDGHLLCNLDKCYLYLLLNVKESINITDPRDYRKAVNNSSIFLKDHLPAGTYQSFGIVYSSDRTRVYNLVRSQIDDDITRSTKKRLNVYVSSKDNIYRYEFYFKRNGKIEDVHKAFVITLPK
jgi:hypothetical protein